MFSFLVDILILVDVVSLSSWFSNLRKTRFTKLISGAQGLFELRRKSTILETSGNLNGKQCFKNA
jgi:hypothetical protein